MLCWVLQPMQPRVREPVLFPAEHSAATTEETPCPVLLLSSGLGLKFLKVRAAAHVGHRELQRSSDT